jgi:uncharacterized membrane protein YgdD (TMEM256/DUF423 family)
MIRLWLIAGAVLGGTAVAAGSFGAHGLKSVLDATGRADNWETAVRYCFYHAAALLVVGLASALPQATRARGLLDAAGWSFLVGTLIFSGCLSVLAVTGLRPLGAIVPLGGVLFLVGWALLTAASARLGG